MPSMHSILSVSSLIFLSSLAIVNTAAAQGTVTAKAGTLGGTVEYTHALSPKLAIGIGYSGLSFSDTINENEISYDADLEMKNFSLIADYHPFESNFRISAGIFSNGNEFSLKAKPTENNEYEINGNPYSTIDVVDSLDGLINFNGIAPYLGVGWGHAPQSGKGWSLDADLGVLFQGSPNVELSVTCVEDTSTECSALQSEDLEAEERSIEEESDEFDVFPVVTLGVSYTF